MAPLVASYDGIICDATKTTAKMSHSCLEDHAVKKELALILGVSQFLDSLPALLLSGFYGNMADRYGRRPVLLLGYLGMVLGATWMTCVVWLAPTIPLRLVWLGPVFTLIGGGPGVPISILMTTATNVVASTQRVSVFSFIHGTALLAVIIGSSISSVAMTSTSNNVPLVAGLSLMCLALLLSLVLPITQQTSSRPSTTSPKNFSPNSIDPGIKGTRKTIWQTKGAIPVIIAGFLSMMGQQVQILILQYMPQAFGISLAKVSISY
jgi:MFS family permease